MAIRFQCPTCKIIRSANERLLGREISCPECSNPVMLPTPEQIEQNRQRKQLAQQQRQMELEHQAELRRYRESHVAFAVADDEDDNDDPHEQMSAEERALAAAATKFTRPKLPSGEDMDMTPMVDVTFLLLIFFMITASFTVQKSIQRPAQKPDEPSTNAVQVPINENPDIVTVQVDEFNAYNIITTAWDRTAGSKQDLIIALNDAHNGDGSGNQPSKLVVQAHEDCFHATVIAALDAGREAQFESFEVSTVEQFD